MCPCPPTILLQKLAEGKQGLQRLQQEREDDEGPLVEREVLLKQLQVGGARRRCVRSRRVAAECLRQARLRRAVPSQPQNAKWQPVLARMSTAARSLCGVFCPGRRTRRTG